MQEHHVGVSSVANQVSVKGIDLVAPAFQDLQENAATMTQNTSDAIGGVVILGGRQNGLGVRFVAGLDRAADINQTNQHSESPVKFFVG